MGIGSQLKYVITILVKDNIRIDIHPLEYADQTWGFEIRYWLFGPKTATTYFQFKETFPTKEKMLGFARRAAQKHFQQNASKILGHLANLAD